MTDLVVTLEDALWKKKGDRLERHDLELTLRREDGKWRRDCSGFARTYDLSFHGEGEAKTETAENAGKLGLAVEIVVERGKGERCGPGARGGVGRYSIELAPGGTGFGGSYGGEFAEFRDPKRRITGESLPVKGAARAVLRPVPFVPGHVAPARGEHPRLFFRKSEIPELRRRAATPLGRRIVEWTEELCERDRGGFRWQRDGSAAWPYTQGTQAAGHAFLYILTGEMRHAERAKLVTTVAMCSTGGEWGGWGLGLRVPGVAVAYDLCADAWDAEFRNKVIEWLLAAAGGRGSSVVSHADAMFNAAGGLAALAILGDQYEMPPEPRPPADAVSMPPPAGAATPDGVPVWKFRSGMPKEWLVAGAFLESDWGDAGEDPLAPVGGRAGARPVDGTRLTHRGLEYEFRRKKWDGRWLYKFNPGRDLAKSGGRPDRSAPTFAYFYAVIENDTPRTVMAEPEGRGSQYGPAKPLYGVSFWLAGKRLRTGDVVRIEKGRYPLMVEVAFLGGTVTAPRLVDYTEDAYRERREEWAKLREAHREAGGAVPLAASRLRRMELYVRRYCELSVGERGFPLEGSNWSDTWHGLLPFVQAYRNVAGVDLAATGEGVGLRWIIPLQMAASGRFWHNDWGDEHWRTMGFSGLVPREHVPALKWYMDRGFEDLRNSWGIVSLPWHGMFALLNYPWETTARAPRELKLPLFVEDRKLGGYIFKSGWDEERDFTLVIQLQTNAPYSALTAGDFSIFGLRGRGRWTGMTTAGGGFFRPPCLTNVERPNVVRVEGAMPVRGTRLLHLSHRPDGSGVMSFVQDSWVKGSAANAHGSPKVEDAKELGIAWHRSIAADYGVGPGAPALFAVADRVTGAGGRRAWLQMNFTKHKGGAAGGLSVNVNRFRVVSTRPPGPVLTGLFVPTGDRLPELECDRRGGFLYLDRPKKGPKLGEKGRPGEGDPVIGELMAGVPRGEAPTPRRTTSVYFVVMAVHEGPAPEFRVEGRGLDAVVTVGDRRVRFDGKKAVISD